MVTYNAIHGSYKPTQNHVRPRFEAKKGQTRPGNGMQDNERQVACVSGEYIPTRVCVRGIAFHALESFALKPRFVFFENRGRHDDRSVQKPRASGSGFGVHLARRRRRTRSRPGASRRRRCRRGGRRVRGLTLRPATRLGGRRRWCGRGDARCFAGRRRGGGGGFAFACLGSGHGGRRARLGGGRG